MNKFIAFIVFGLMSTFTHAQVTIQTDNRVEILAVNQVINDIPKKAKGDLKISNGANQLMIRVTAMVDGNGGKQKFNSLPMVVKFEANDQTLKFETPFAIRDERAVTRFKKSPSVKVTSAGQPIAIETDLIFDQTFALIKDYDSMLNEYNLAGGVASIAVNNETVSTKAPVAEEPTLVKTNVASAGIRDEFLLMTPEQRQEFISWAVKHINE